MLTHPQLVRTFLCLLVPSKETNPTACRIGLLYNAIPYQYWKDEVEKWAKVKYPEQWAQLAEVERTESEEDGYKFHIKDNPVYA